MGIDKDACGEMRTAADRRCLHPGVLVHPGIILHARLVRRRGFVLHPGVAHLRRLGLDIRREHIKLDDVGLAREQLVHRREECCGDLAIEMLLPPLVGREEIDDGENAGAGELDSVPEQRVWLGFDEGEGAL
jgi:hypothetical protein